MRALPGAGRDGPVQHPSRCPPATEYGSHGSTAHPRDPAPSANSRDHGGSLSRGSFYRAGNGAIERRPSMDDGFGPGASSVALDDPAHIREADAGPFKFSGTM